MHSSGVIFIVFNALDFFQDLVFFFFLQFSSLFSYMFIGHVHAFLVYLFFFVGVSFSPSRFRLFSVFSFFIFCQFSLMVALTKSVATNCFSVHVGS